jgi:hypothetical protein
MPRTRGPICPLIAAFIFSLSNTDSSRSEGCPWRSHQRSATGAVHTRRCCNVTGPGLSFRGPRAGAAAAVGAATASSAAECHAPIHERLEQFGELHREHELRDRARSDGFQGLQVLEAHLLPVVRGRSGTYTCPPATAWSALLHCDLDGSILGSVRLWQSYFEHSIVVGCCRLGALHLRGKRHGP